MDFLSLLQRQGSISDTELCVIEMIDQIQHIPLNQFHILLCWANECMLACVSNNGAMADLNDKGAC